MPSAKNKGEQTMKTRNQFFGLIAIAIITLALAALPLAGCKSDDPTDTPQEQPVGYITDTAGNQIIPIYKTDGVSDTDATTAVSNIKTAWNANGLNPYRDTLSAGIKKIYILAGSSDDLYSLYKPTGILNMGSGWTTENIIACLVYAVYPALQSPYKNYTPRDLSFGTNCKVTITSDDTFLPAEWTTLCDKVVAAIEMGYNTATALAKPILETYFTNYTVSAVLLKSATLDCEVKSDVPNTMYLKADGSTIDGISDSNIRSAITAARTGGSFSTP